MSKMTPVPKKPTVVLFCVLLLALPEARANLLTNPDFESGSYTQGRLNVYDQWMGEPAAYVTAEQGITPHQGSGMLRINGTSLNPLADGDIGDVTQYIDLAPYAAQVAAGTFQVRGSVFANRVAGDSQTDTSFRLYLRAFTGDVSSPSAAFDLVADTMFTDSDPGTWEELSATWTVPTTTDYLLFQVYTAENVFDDVYGSATEFDGHYFDNASLQIIPEPSVLGFLVLGGIFAGRLLLQRKIL